MEIQSYTNSPQYSLHFTSLATTLGNDLGPVCTKIQKTIESFPQADGIAGYLPQGWVSKINARGKTEKYQIKSQIFHKFRDSVELVRKGKLKEASELITSELRKFGILSSENRLVFKKRHVKGGQIDGAYYVKEYGKNPLLEKLFIKSFKEINPLTVEADYHGFSAEIVRGFYVNKLFKNNPHFVKTSWGDFKGKFMAFEYVLPPKGKYKKPPEFDFWNFLSKFGLQHGDLHDGNIILGTYKGKPIWKLIDLGGLGFKYQPKKNI